MITNIVDAVIIIIFIIGILNGFRNGAIKSVVGLIGIIIALVLAFQLKNPIAKILYSNLPFFEFKILKEVAVFNILFYEFISFIIVFVLLLFVLRVVLKVTGILQKLLDLTIILGFGSRVIGAILGFIETYVIVFVLLFFLNQPYFDLHLFDDSKINKAILNETPILTSMVHKKIEVMNELFELKKIYDNTAKADEYNYQTLDILLKYNIITVDSVKTLKEKNKLNFKNINELIIKYGG